MDKTVIVIILIVVVLGVGFFLWQYKPIPQNPVSPTPLPTGIIFFYSNTCPHCKNVEDFVAQNNIADKIKFISLEVSENQANAQLFINTGESCKLGSDSLGAVPMLYDGSKCYVGDVDIINFFKNAAGIK